MCSERVNSSCDIHRVTFVTHPVMLSWMKKEDLLTIITMLSRKCMSIDEYLVLYLRNCWSIFVYFTCSAYNILIITPAPSVPLVYALSILFIYIYIYIYILECKFDRYGRGRMQSMHIDSNPTHGEVHSFQHYVRKFVSELRQDGCFALFLAVGGTGSVYICQYRKLVF